MSENESKLLLTYTYSFQVPHQNPTKDWRIPGKNQQTIWASYCDFWCPNVCSHHCTIPRPWQEIFFPSNSLQASFLQSKSVLMEEWLFQVFHNTCNHVRRTFLIFFVLKFRTIWSRKHEICHLFSKAEIAHLIYRVSSLFWI